MSNRTVLLLLGVFLAIRTLTLPIVPLTGHTEGRYATIALEMADSGDWITPRTWIDGTHVPFLGKPPLHFWASALSIHLFGANEFAVRFPSLIGATLLNILLWRFLRRWGERDLALWAVLMVSSCVLFFVLAGAAVTDMTLSLCVTGSVLSYQTFLMETGKSQKRFWSLSVFFFLGLGFLAKGPVAAIMFGIPVFLWTLLHKRWATLKDHAWWLGISLFLSLTVPWFTLAEIRNPSFLKYFFYNENLLRFVTHDYGDLYGRGHQFPYGTAIPMLLVVGLPWTFWCAITLFSRCGWHWLIETLRDERVSLFPLALIGMTLFLCFARQLLLTYLLPVLPFFAIWGAMLLRKSGVTRKTLLRVSMAAVIVYGLAYPLIYPRIETRSTNGLIRLARETRTRLSLDGGLIFISGIPYSAYFYGHDFVLPIASEGAGLRILKSLDSGKGHLYAIERKLQARAPSYIMDRLERVGTWADWSLYRSTSKP